MSQWARGQDLEAQGSVGNHQSVTGSCVPLGARLQPLGLALSSVKQLSLEHRVQTQLFRTFPGADGVFLCKYDFVPSTTHPSPSVFITHVLLSQWAGRHQWLSQTHPSPQCAQAGDQEDGRREYLISQKDDGGVSPWHFILSLCSHGLACLPQQAVT